MAKAGKDFSVDTHPTKQVVVGSLTRDVSVETCVFDLIDNAIDAARDVLFQGTPPKERNHLPESFVGYEVKLTLSGAGLKIEDNCGGISVADLKKMVMRFGQLSTHEMGIGAFGVGLNRALFKLGRVSHLRTDTGTQRAEFVLKTDDYLHSTSWHLPATEYKSSGTRCTEIEIRQIPTDIAQQFADSDWVDRLRSEIGRRYARFIARHFAIRVNNVPVRDEEPAIREDSPYEGEYKFYKTEDGVSIHLEYGQHAEHRFQNERDYDAERNKRITDQFGWTILCNDRAILIADRSWKTGWDTKFHTEFYGFLGFASFTCADPAKLPWNTTKTDVDLNNAAYQSALDDMRKFDAKWRQQAEKRKRKTAAPQPLPPKPTSTKRPKKKAPTAKRVTTKVDHNQFRTILPRDVLEKKCFDKHLKLVHEAKDMDLADFTYAGLVLIRMLFETSVVTYLVREKKYDDLKKFAVARHTKERPMSAEAEKNFLPSLDDILAFLAKDHGVWGAAKSNYLKHSLSKLASHKALLNSAAHNPFQTINRTVGFEIRDDALPLLRHLIET
jgi:hypothetical protein